MKRLLLLLVLLSALSLPGLAGAANYYSDPNGSGSETCVDNILVASGGHACTIVRAEAVATNGDTVIANCGTYSLGATTFTVNVNIHIYPVTDYCATITGTNATSIVTLTAANNAAVLEFGKFVVENTGGATTSTMLVSNVAYDQVVKVYPHITVGGTARHIADQWTRGTVYGDGIWLSGTMGSQAGWYGLVTPSSAKKVSIVGGTFTLTGSAVLTSAILLERNAGNATSYWVYVASNTFTLTSTGTSTLYGVRLNRISHGTDLSGNITPPIIELNNGTMTDTATSGATYFFVTASTDATATADGTVIRNNYPLTVSSKISGCTSIGTDGTTAFFAANTLTTGNKCTQTFYDGVNSPHNIYVGRVTGAIVSGNESRGGAVGIICSMATTCTVTGNLVEGSYYAPLFAKGNTSAVFENNTVIMDDALYGAPFGSWKACLSVSVQGATNNAATTFQNNNCYVRSGTGWSYAVVANSQVATYEHNNYFSLVTLTTPWSYQSTTYATVSLWNAAGTVGTDTNVDPVFVDPANDYRLAAPSPLRRAGLYLDAKCGDVRGRRCFIPLDVGGYQSSGGDPAADRTARQ